MSLGLDLANAERKWDRAVEHVESLDREIKRVLKANQPYTIRFGKIDEESGWRSIYLTPCQVPENQLGIIFGDVLHNMRCVLDYIVTALADKDGVTGRGQHQFPVYTDKTKYEDDVASQIVKGKGPLAHLKSGVDTIESLQPYHQEPDPRSHPLCHIQRFSNADKHRLITVDRWWPGTGQVRITMTPRNARVIEREDFRALDKWHPDREYEIARLRFARPYPTQVRADGRSAIRPIFSTPPYRSELGLLISMETLCGTRNYLRGLLDHFKRL